MTWFLRFSLPIELFLKVANSKLHSKFNMETKFSPNDIVYERINPFRKMVVKRFVNGLYYCHFPESLKRLFVYAERELMRYPAKQSSQD